MNQRAYHLCTIFFGMCFVPFWHQHTLEIHSLVISIFLIGLVLHRKKKNLPPLIRFGFLSGGVLLIFQQYGTLRGLETGVGLLTFLGILKTTELASSKDVFICFLISKLLLIGHLLSEDSLAYLPYVMICSLFLFIALFSSFNKKSFVQEKEGLVFCLKTLIYSIPLGVALFLMFPRIPVGNLFASKSPPVSKMGFSEEVRPGDFAKIVSNKETLFRARFLSDNKISFQDLYWRGAVLSKVTGMTWKRGRLGLFVEKRPPYGAVLYRYEVNFNVFQEDFIFLLDGTTSFKRRSRGRLIRKGGYVFRIRPQLNQKIDYMGTVTETYTDYLPAVEKKKYLQLPEVVSEKVKEYVEDIKTRHQSQEKRVQALLNDFRVKGFEYTLEPGVLEGNLLESFLFETKRGYCEHYASAIGILLRMMGIPTRLVVGFHGGVYNPFGNYFSLRGQDAHAWVEFWSEKKRWKRIDPVKYVARNRIELGSDVFFQPSKELRDILEKGQVSSWWKRFLFTADMIYYKTGLKFTGLDYQVQKDFLNRFGITKKIAFKLILGLIAFVIIFIGAGAVLMRHRQQRKRSEFDRAFINLYKKLEKKGLKRKIWMGPWDYFHSFANRVKNMAEIKKDISKLCFKQIRS